MRKTVSIGADHGGFKLKSAVAKWLSENNYDVRDKGCFDETSVDYPDIAHLVSLEVASGAADFGVLICTSGIGMSIAANKQNGVRAALCHNEDSAKFSRLHNNANIICLGAKYTPPELAVKMVQTFAETDFEGGRHQRRVDKMCALES